MVPSFYEEILSWIAPPTRYFQALMQRCKLCKTSDHVGEQKERTWAFYDSVERLSYLILLLTIVGDNKFSFIQTGTPRTLFLLLLLLLLLQMMPCVWE